MPARDPRSIDAILADLPATQRATLQRLRKAVRAVAPSAEECISYGLPAFRLNERALVAYGATAKHCAFYPMSGAIIAAFREDLAKFDTSKGTIRFQPDRPLSVSLIRKIVQARMAENGVATKARGDKGRKAAALTRRAGRGAKSEVKSKDNVDAFMAALKHPLKNDIEAVRRIILDASPKIGDGVKWNSLSFRTDEYFATVHLRGTDAVRLVFHRGAKVKDNSSPRPDIPDPKRLIEWLALDRCMVNLGSGKAIQANKQTLTTIVKKWIAQM